jgi:hypothetical protein
MYCNKVRGMSGRPEDLTETARIERLKGNDTYVVRKLTMVERVCDRLGPWTWIMAAFVMGIIVAALVLNPK